MAPERILLVRKLVRKEAKVSQLAAILVLSCFTNELMSQLSADRKIRCSHQLVSSFTYEASASQLLCFFYFFKLYV